MQNKNLLKLAGKIFGNLTRANQIMKRIKYNVDFLDKVIVRIDYDSDNALRSAAIDRAFIPVRSDLQSMPLSVIDIIRGTFFPSDTCL